MVKAPGENQAFAENQEIASFISTLGMKASWVTLGRA